MAHKTIKSAGARFVIVTGLSGSGKSQAIHALEDRGFFCVDNLPSALMPTLADLVVHAEGENAKAAVVVDVREGKFLSALCLKYGFFTFPLHKINSLSQSTHLYL